MDLLRGEMKAQWLTLKSRKLCIAYVFMIGRRIVKLSRVIIRSFRSLNYDYQKKLTTSAEAFSEVRRPWEEDDFEIWRPYLEVPLDPLITPVVGANESGKTHLLDAIEKVLSGQQVFSEEICRYSPDYEKRYTTGHASIGLGCVALTGEEEAFIIAALFPESDRPATISEVLFIWHGDTPYDIYVFFDGNHIAEFSSVGPEASEAIRHMLPPAIRIQPDVRLPSTVSADVLLKEWGERNPDVDTSSTFYTRGTNEYVQISVSPEEKLAFDLLFNLGSVNEQMLADLRRGDIPTQLMDDLAREVTHNLQQSLNLSYWWGQDIDIVLGVTFEQNRIRFSLTDRTGRSYGFEERSRGLQYFLGHLVQFIAQYQYLQQPSLILSDEPDYALSISGQQDLLRTLDKLAMGGANHAPHQVIYTTHSPFLINRNYPKRIVALRKGIYDEGTQIISRPYHRMYEPLRTALGMPAIAIPFMDSANIVVEGISDQTFLVGISQYLAANGRPHLDLNNVPIIVAGGTDNLSSVLGAAYTPLSGKAYVTVLLDSDDKGKEAYELLKEDFPSLVASNQVVLLGQDYMSGVGHPFEIEDVVPPELYYEAFAVRYKSKLSDPKVAEYFLQQDLITRQNQDESLADRYTAVFRDYANAAGSDSDLPLLLYDKDGIMQALMQLLNGDEGILQRKKKYFASFVKRMEALTRSLDERVARNQEQKRFDEIRKAISDRIYAFSQKHPSVATKAETHDLLAEVKSIGLPIDREDKMSAYINRLIEQYEIKADALRDSVLDYPSLLRSIKDLPKRYTLS